MSHYRKGKTTKSISGPPLRKYCTSPSSCSPSYLYALLDPEVAAHGLPVLRAADVEQPLVDAPLHGGVEHLEELGSDQRLSAAEPREEGGLQLGRDVTS